jgi:uncharacterized membrane protein
VLFFGLLLAAIPFILPIASWVAARRTRARVEELSRTISDQQAAIDRLSTQLGQLRREVRTAEPAGREDVTAAAAATAGPAAPSAPKEKAPPPTAVTPAPVPSPVPLSAPPVAPRENPWPDLAHLRPAPAAAKSPEPPAAPKENPWPELARGPELARAREKVSEPPATTTARPVPPPPSPPPPRRPTSAGAQPPSGFDFESLLGVKLFSAVAGIALVLAAIFFLKYSVEHGWLQPPIRVLIGTAVGVSLLVVCELKAARRYPITANALDAAAIAVLFSTFFAAHALWNLIPSIAAFFLLAMVTAIAVLLSIRRESLFIAVLGLLGGFATPALLSTGENRPIPLFAYLMLLNIGLAWVAYRQVWPLLTALTVVFTAVYQWLWVFKFLDASSLPLGMGIFAIFPLAALAGFAIARGRRLAKEPSGADSAFEYTALSAAAMPLLFAIYLSTVPAYGNRPSLLFGFLLLVDAGLFVVAVARTRVILHVAGAMATLVVMACWLAFSYTNGAYVPALGFCAAFVTFFVGAPAAASLLGYPAKNNPADFAAPLLLFVPAVLARIEPAFVDPLPLFATIFLLVVVIAWRAIADRRGDLYFIAAFFMVAAQGIWSSTHLDIDRLGTAVAVYGAFGLLSTMVPLVARSIGRPLEPRTGGGLVLIASLALLLFLSLGNVSAAALWALALLLAILNAGLFIESGFAGLPFVSVAGSLLSWIVLASWWARAGAAVGVVPSLTVLIGLTLVTFAGHAWVNRRWGRETTGRAAGFGDGLYLGLVGHLFLLAVSTNPAWSIPPWPVFGTLAVLTLTASTVSLLTERAALHVGGATAAATIVAAWTYGAGSPWSLVGLIASAAASVFALLWIPIDRGRLVRQGAAAVLFLGELTATIAARQGSSFPFAVVVAAHVLNLSVLLALTFVERWRGVALCAVFAGCYAVAVQWVTFDLASGWQRLLALSSAIYAVFIAYPLALGRRAHADRDPSIAAVLASAMLFVAARAALTAGGYGWMVGALPVAEGAVMAILLRQLLKMEQPGARDVGRLALVAGTALAFVTVAIPLQLHRQWITIGWALEGAALAWLFRRIRHRGLLYWSLALLGAVFVRLAMNPEILRYEPRGSMRILNWYLYAYLVCAAAFLLAAWWLSPSNGADARAEEQTYSSVLAGAAVVLLFLLLNIEIADFYATGPTIMFRFGVTVSQDLTYTLGWLMFGMALLAACIYLHSRFGRVAALVLIALTTFKCFLYDLGSLEGLYRVGSFVGLAMSLALVSLALQKFVLAKAEEQA